VEKWLGLAEGVREPAATPPIPVLLAEALDLAGVVAQVWEPVEGDEPRPGLASAVATGAIPATLVTDLRELAVAVAHLHGEFRGAIAGPPPAPVERGRALRAELRNSLAFLFTDGARAAEAAAVARVAMSQAETASHDGLALCLEGLAIFADGYRAELGRLPGFDPAVIDEALRVAARLREQSSLRAAAAVNRHRRAAHSARNRLLALLVDRVGRARRALRFVFRHHEDIAKLASSDYQRRRRAAARAARRAAAAATPPAAATPRRAT